MALQDEKSYLKKMEDALKEKTFFLDKVNFYDLDYFIDFGCANGIILGKINDFVKHNAKIIGFDKNKNFLEICKKNFSSYDNLYFFSDFEKLLNLIENKKYGLLLSSCLHELDSPTFNKILNLMKNSQVVVIRDMYFDNLSNRKIKFSKEIFKDIEEYKFSDFENRYGKIDNLKNLYHFLLKYTYTENWNSEILENYFSVDYEKILNELNKDFYIDFDECYTLKFKKDEVFTNFGFDMILPTHRKLILKRR